MVKKEIIIIDNYTENIIGHFIRINIKYSTNNFKM